MTCARCGPPGGKSRRLGSPGSPAPLSGPATWYAAADSSSSGSGHRAEEGRKKSAVQENGAKLKSVPLSCGAESSPAVIFVQAIFRARRAQKEGAPGSPCDWGPFYFLPSENFLIQSAPQSR